MKKNNKEILVLLIILIVTLFLRVPDLGYSHFYGDETKTLYLRKDVGAKEFLLNQRKGPVQFLVAWGAEKFSGGYNEKSIRLPFALAGTLAVFTFYLVVKELLNWHVAALSSFMFSLNGFNVAFSRTAQYQSFLLLFGLLSILLVLYSMNSNKKLRAFLFFLSGTSLALAYLSHYDAIFFDVVVAVILVKTLIKENWDKKLLRQIFVYMVMPFILVLLLFFVPYVVHGYFGAQTLNYLSRRVTGEHYLINSSIFTFSVYNPLYFWVFLLFFSVFACLSKFGWVKILLLIWFIVPYILFELIFSNPGTHIHNYFLPLYILSSVGIVTVARSIKHRALLLGFSGIVGIVVGLTFIYSANYFIPAVSTGYPWKSSSVLVWDIPRLEKSHHIFIYGFPYNVGWDQVKNYFGERGAPRSFYTNDNLTIGEYYLQGVAAHIPRNNQFPQYYIYVINGQELLNAEEEKSVTTLLSKYTAEKEIFVNGDLASIIYKKSPTK